MKVTSFTKSKMRASLMGSAGFGDDLRRVNKEVDRRLFHPCQIAAKRLLERQAPLRALFDRYSFAVLQALRT